MRTVGNTCLLMLQWTLVALGILVVCFAIREYMHFAVLPPVAAGDDHFVIPIFGKLLGGLSLGLCAIGLGAVLFYLRRLYLSR